MDTVRSWLTLTWPVIRLSSWGTVRKGLPVCSHRATTSRISGPVALGTASRIRSMASSSTSFGISDRAAADRHAVDIGAVTAQLVVDEGDGLVLPGTGPAHVAHQHLAGAPGADDQHPDATAEAEAMVLEPAVEQSRPGQQQQLEAEEQQRHRARQFSLRLNTNSTTTTASVVAATAFRMRSRSGSDAKRQTPR
jgi:hypothetical protein